jgi:hypothetical protein
MKNEHNKNEALRGPLMFTIPACGFVVAPKLDWLYKINRVADHTKKLTVTHREEYGCDRLTRTISIGWSLTWKTVMNAGEIKDWIRKLSRIDKIEIYRWIDDEMAADLLPRIGVLRNRTEVQGGDPAKRVHFGLAQWYRSSHGFFKAWEWAADYFPIRSSDTPLRQVDATATEGVLKHGEVADHRPKYRRENHWWSLPTRQRLWPRRPLSA